MSRSLALSMPRSLMLSVLLAGAVASVADADASRAPAPAAPAAVRPVPAAQGLRFHSGMGARQRLVVRDKATWTKVWAELAGTSHPTPAAPAIDFTRDVVIVASMGGKNSGGYAISVDDVRVVGRNARITVTERSPGQQCMVTMALTAPVAVVVAPRFAGQAKFVERATVSDCK